MKKLKNSAMLVVAGLCGYLALMTPDWKSELSAMSGVGYLPNNNYNELSGDVSDVLMRSTTTGQYTLYEIDNYQVLTSNSPALSTNTDDKYIATLEKGDGSGDVVVLTRKTSNGTWTAYNMADKDVTGSAPETGLPSSSSMAYVAVGDIDADGDDDVLMRNTSTGVYTAYFFQNGAVTSNGGYNAFTNLTVIPQGMADLDSDGDDELIQRASSTGIWYVARSEGGVVQANVALSGLYLSSNYSYSFASDLNGDGYDDIVLRQTGGTGNVGQFLQFQYGRTTPGDVRFVITSASGLNMYFDPVMISLGAIGDYNADGRTDVILRDTRNYWWLAQMGPSGVPVTPHSFVYLNTNPDYTIQQSID